MLRQYLFESNAPFGEATDNFAKFEALRNDPMKKLHEQHDIGLPIGWKELVEADPAKGYWKAPCLHNAGDKLDKWRLHVTGIDLCGTQAKRIHCE
jgi:hypothetical protein